MSPSFDTAHVRDYTAEGLSAEVISSLIAMAIADLAGPAASDGRGGDTDEDHAQGHCLRIARMCGDAALADQLKEALARQGGGAGAGQRTSDRPCRPSTAALVSDINGNRDRGID